MCLNMYILYINMYTCMYACVDHLSHDQLDTCMYVCNLCVSEHEYYGMANLTLPTSSGVANCFVILSS